MNLFSGPPMTGYFDSSALVKRYVVETGSTWVQAWCGNPMHTIALAEIGLVEMVSALSKLPSGGFITPSEYRNIRANLTLDAQHEYTLIALKRSVVDEAIELTSRHRLHSYQAVHLASALNLNRNLGTLQLPPMLFISADKVLLAAAAAEGLAIENPLNYP